MKRTAIQIDEYPPVFPACPVEIELIPYIHMEIIRRDVYRDVLCIDPEGDADLQHSICAGLCNTDTSMSSRRTLSRAGAVLHLS